MVFDKKAWSKKYNARADIKEKNRLRINRHRKNPDVKQRIKEYEKEYRKNPEFKKKKKIINSNYRKNPDVKSKIKNNRQIYVSKPEVRIRINELARNYNNKPDVKARREVYRKKEDVIEKNKIRQLTRKKYPITNQKCEFCNSPASEHHHFTMPYEVDKFNYVCHSCNIRQDNERRCKQH